MAKKKRRRAQKIAARLKHQQSLKPQASKPAVDRVKPKTSQIVSPEKSKKKELSWLKKDLIRSLLLSLLAVGLIIFLKHQLAVN